MIDITTACIALITFLLTLAYTKSRRLPRSPPGPFAWPFVGNLFDVTRSKKPFHFVANDYYKKYGPLTSLQMAFYPAVLVTDLKILKGTLVEKDIFSDRAMWLPFFKHISKRSPKGGVVLVNGDGWKTNQKLSMAALRDPDFGITTLEQKAKEEAEAILAELERIIGQEFDFRLTFNNATANVICSVLFGRRFEYDDKEFTDTIAKIAFLLSSGGFQNPFQFLPTFLFPLMPLTMPNLTRYRHYATDFRAFLTRRIDEHKATLSDEINRDLVDLCLKSGVADRDLRQILADLLIAGSETTSNTLMWAFLFMIKYPDIQEKCRQEILQNVGSDRLPVLKDKPALPYTCATIMEVQRLGAVGPIFPFHNCAQTVEMNGYVIPKDTLVFTNVYSVLVDPKHWDEPEEFRPERFLSDDKKTTIKPEAFIPFGLGRRSCLGENLAKMELFIFFSCLLQNFRFTAADPDRVPGHHDCTLGTSCSPNRYSLIVSSV